MDAIMGILADFDLAAFLPRVNTLLGWTETLLRLCVMIGPLLLLAFGLVYLLSPPKEANYSVGYRFYWGMSSLEAWKFTHTVAGSVWTGLGLVLSIVMAVICNVFRKMDIMAMVWAAVKCLCWELGLILLSILAINVTVVIIFDRYGYRRGEYSE